MDLTLTSTHLSYVARSTHLLNISSYILLPCTDSKVDQSKVHYKSSVEVDGYECDIRLYPVGVVPGTRLNSSSSSSARLAQTK